MSFEANPFAIQINDSYDEPEVTRVRKKVETQESAMPTIFDVEEYFQKTDRGHLVFSVGHLNNPRVLKALEQDLAVSETAEERMKIRKLLLVAKNNGYLKPEYDKQEIKNLINQRIGNLRYEYMRKAEAQDDVETEEYLIKNWRRLLWLLSVENEVMDDEELLFAEEVRDEMQSNLKYNPKSRRAKDVCEKLDKITTAMYYRAFLPQVLKNR